MLSGDIPSTHVSELSEVSLNFIIADLRNQSADENLSGASLSLLGVNLLVVDDVITSLDDFVNGIGILVDDEGETARATGGRICLNVDAVNFSVLTKVITKLLCKDKRNISIVA